MRKALCLIVILLLAGCTSESNAQRALQAAGYKDIRMTGYRFFGCSEDDFSHTGFEATGQNGQRISGVVCSGLFFKGSTIRTD